MSQTLRDLWSPVDDRTPFDFKANSLPHRYKSRLVPQGSTPESYSYPLPLGI